MCKFTLTIKFEQYRLKKFEGEFIKLRQNKKLMDVLREIFEADGNVAEIDLKVGDEEFCH